MKRKRKTFGGLLLSPPTSDTPNPTAPIHTPTPNPRTTPHTRTTAPQSREFEKLEGVLLIVYGNESDTFEFFENISTVLFEHFDNGM